jgi:hypothetical protein
MVKGLETYLNCLGKPWEIYCITVFASWRLTSVYEPALGCLGASFELGSGATYTKSDIDLGGLW